MKKKLTKTLTIYLRDFLEYFVKIIKKWYLWLSFIPNFASNILEHYKIPFEIPSFLNIVIPFIGILVSGYLVYKEMLASFPSTIFHNPHLAISLVEGNEYNFLLSSPYDSTVAKLELMNTDKEKIRYEDDLLYLDDKLQYWLPKMMLTINVRIENDGDVPIDILNIKNIYTPTDFYPLKIYQDEVQINSTNIDFPVNLEPTRIELIQLQLVLSPDGSKVISIAQIAASISKLRKSFSMDLLVDTLNKLGNQEEYKVPMNISFRPLVDDFVSQLQHYKQEDLLRIIQNSGR